MIWVPSGPCGLKGRYQGPLQLVAATSLFDVVVVLMGFGSLAVGFGNWVGAGKAMVAMVPATAMAHAAKSRRVSAVRLFFSCGDFFFQSG